MAKSKNKPPFYATEYTIESSEVIVSFNPEDQKIHITSHEGGIAVDLEEAPDVVLAIQALLEEIKTRT